MEQLYRRKFHHSRQSFARVLATDDVDDVNMIYPLLFIQKIILNDNEIQLCVQIFQNRGHIVDVKKTLPENELIKIIGDYDGLVVRSATKVISIEYS